MQSVLFWMTYETSGHVMELSLVTEEIDEKQFSEPQEVLPVIEENQLTAEEVFPNVTMEYIVDELIRTSSGYELRDTSETVRYFDHSGRLYEIKDEKGNQVLYTFDGSSTRITKITEKTGASVRSIELTYDVNGRLDTVKDFKNTPVKFAYATVNNQPVLQKITFAVGTTAEKTVEFGYDPTTARLTSVKDANGNTGKIEYDKVNNRVTKLIDPRSSSIYSQLIYANQKTTYVDSKGNKTEYTYSIPEARTVNVTQIIENAGGANQSTTKYEWKNNLLEKEYEPDKDTGAAATATTITQYDSKGNVTGASTTGNQSFTQTIDAKNNVVSSKESSGIFENNIYDAVSNLISSTTNFNLTDYSQYDKFGNVTRSVSPTRDIYNRLANSQFETADASGLPSGWIRFSASNAGSHTLSTDSKFGQKAAQISLSGTGDAGYFRQQFKVDPAESQRIYTVSARVKTINLTGEGARIRIYPLDSANVNLKNTDGSIYQEMSAPLTGTTDWTELSKTVTLPAGTAAVRVDLLAKGQGTALFDGVQAVYGTTLPEYSANENTGFEAGASASLDGWTLNNLGTGDGPSTVVKQSGASSVRVTGNGTQRYAGQYVEVKGKQNDPITFSGWANTTSAAAAGDLKLRLWLTYTDGTSASFDLPFMSGSHAHNKWQFAKNTIRAPKDFKQAKIYAIYSKTSGYAYFDNIKVEPTGSSVGKTYDANGVNMTSETDAFGNTTTYVYDANGNETKVTDAENRVKDRQYDPMNRVTSVSLGPTKGIQTTYSYDKQGNLLSRIDPRGNKTSFSYNAINEVERETDPLGKFYRYEYDGEANVTKIERGQNTTVSSTVTFGYDAKNNEVTKSVNGAKLYDKTYFKNNLLKSILTPADGTYTFDYDSSQRLTKAVSPGYTIENIYETASSNPANGLRTSFKETLGTSVFTTRYAYDGSQRLTTLTAPDNTAYNYFFNERSQPVRQESPNVVQLHEFDEDGQLTAQTVLGQSSVQYRYSYDRSGQVISYAAGNKTHRYTYDEYNRLVKWHNGSKETSYRYDIAGNLENPQGRTLSFNTANEVAGFTYDSEGNLLDDGRLTYTWDGLGQLVSSTDQATGSQVRYTYHPDGLRKTKIVGSTIHRYHYDGSQLVRITDSSGRTVWAFTWNASKLIQVTNAAGETFEAVTNHRGDVVRLLDKAGNTVAEYDYDPWGNLVSPEPSDSRVKGQPIRYAGYVYDTEMKLYYLQARYYDPATSRFVSRDPDPGDEDDPATMNGYTYADGNPVTKIDPDGHFAQFIPIAIAGYRVYKAYKTYKKVKGLTKVTNKTGTYVISYSNGYKYIGKGSLKRARKSAKQHQKKDGAKINTIAWRPAKNSRQAFIREYKLMKKMVSIQMWQETKNQTGTNYITKLIVQGENITKGIMVDIKIRWSELNVARLNPD